MAAQVGIGRRNQNPVPLSSRVVAGYSVYAAIHRMDTFEKLYRFAATDFKSLNSPTFVILGHPGAWTPQQVPPSRDFSDFSPTNTELIAFNTEGQYVLTMALELWTSGFADQADQYVTEATGKSRIATQAPFHVTINVM
ncbi:MAG TPA: hypothetical protein VJO34_15865 [Methylomirabilota bacterium]|nr:hypothetical protein [Methylomirabilota bacterium]